MFIWGNLSKKVEGMRRKKGVTKAKTGKRYNAFSREIEVVKLGQW